MIREDVERRAELGVDLWAEHVPLVLEAMQGIAAELGLDVGWRGRRRGFRRRLEECEGGDRPPFCVALP